MSNSRPTSLPIISITPWLLNSDNEAARLEISAALHAACRDFGFFYLNISDYASEEEMSNLLHLARRFFGLKQEEKDKISIRNQDNVRGPHVLWLTFENG